MEKSKEAFRTISEVADSLDVPAHVLRFWESKFAQVKPIKRGGGRRYYRPDDVNLLKGIRELLYTDGMTIKGVQKVLRDQGSRSVATGAAEAAGGIGSVAAKPAAIARPAVAKPVQPELFAAKAEPVPLRLDRLANAQPAPAGLSAAQRKELASIVDALEALRESMRR